MIAADANIGISLLIILFLILMGFIIELIPITKKIFAIHEPIILPNEISGLFCKAAPNDIANSGAEVPKATIINEIIIDEIPIFAAVFDVPSTNTSEPFHRNIIPIMNDGIDRATSIIFLDV